MIAIVRDSLLVASTFQTVGNTGRQNYDIVYEILFQNYKKNNVKGYI